MITKVTKIDILNLVGQIVNGIFSNSPTTNMLFDPTVLVGRGQEKEFSRYDQYQRQQIIQNAINDVQQAFIATGIEIIDENER